MHPTLNEALVLLEYAVILKTMKFEEFGLEFIGCRIQNFIIQTSMQGMERLNTFFETTEEL